MRMRFANGVKFPFFFAAVAMLLWLGVGVGVCALVSFHIIFCFTSFVIFSNARSLLFPAIRIFDSECAHSVRISCGRYRANNNFSAFGRVCATECKCGPISATRICLYSFDGASCVRAKKIRDNSLFAGGNPFPVSLFLLLSDCVEFVANRHDTRHLRAHRKHRLCQPTEIWTRRMHCPGPHNKLRQKTKSRRKRIFSVQFLCTENELKASQAHFTGRTEQYMVHTAFPLIPHGWSVCFARNRTAQFNRSTDDHFLKSENENTFSYFMQRRIAQRTF